MESQVVTDATIEGISTPPSLHTFDLAPDTPPPYIIPDVQPSPLPLDSL